LKKSVSSDGKRGLKTDILQLKKWQRRGAKAIEWRSLLEKASSGELGERGEMFLGSKCLNEPSFCCSSTVTYPRRKRVRTKRKLHRLQKDITTLLRIVW
jgi:hypothetical protein